MTTPHAVLFNKKDVCVAIEFWVCSWSLTKWWVLAIDKIYPPECCDFDDVIWIFNITVINVECDTFVELNTGGGGRQKSWECVSYTYASRTIQDFRSDERCCRADRTRPHFQITRVLKDSFLSTWGIWSRIRTMTGQLERRTLGMHSYNHVYKGSYFIDLEYWSRKFSFEIVLRFSSFQILGEATEKLLYRDNYNVTSSTWCEDVFFVEAKQFKTLVFIIIKNSIAPLWKDIGLRLMHFMTDKKCALSITYVITAIHCRHSRPMSPSSPSSSSLAHGSVPPWIRS